MIQLDCPACGKRATSPARKLLVDGVRPFPCRACGEPLRLPAVSGAAYGLVGIGLVALLWLGIPRPLRFLVLVPTLGSLAWFQLWRVPFVSARDGVSLSE